MIVRALAAVSTLLVAVLVVAIDLDVLLRLLADRPMRGVTELVSLAVPAMTFLALPLLTREQRLFRAGVLERWLNAAGTPCRAGFEALYATLSMLLAAAIAWALAPELLRAVRDREFIGVAGDFTAPLWPALAGTVVAAAFLAAQSGASLARSVNRIATRGMRAVLPLLLLALPTLMLLADTRAAAGVTGIVLLLVFLVAGLPVVYALMLAAVAGITTIKGDAGVAVETLGMAASGAVSSYVFAAVPMFVLLGMVVGRAGIGRDSLVAAQWLLGRVVGGLGVATVFANAVFAAITGISIASASIFSRVAAPPLVEQGFTPRFAVGLIAGSSVLGMLIPPSLLLIVYGLVAEVSINALFLAAIVPGLLLTAFFCAVVMLLVWRRSPLAVRADYAGDRRVVASGREAAARAWPIGALVIAVLGGIYLGWFTPTEAGAVGALTAFVLGALLRRLSWRDVAPLLAETASTSASILFLIVGASAFGIMLTLSGIPAALSAAVAAAGLGLAAYALGYLAILVVLGMVLDSTSILLIMVPIALPAVTALGGDLVWFGILTVVGVEIGLLTPPLGLSVFAIKSSLEDSDDIALNDIFLGALPFVAMMLLLCLLLIAVPGLGCLFV